MFQGMSELPDYNKISFPENPPIPFEEILPDASEQAIDLLKRFLVYPSKQRISAKEVIHYYTISEVTRAILPLKVRSASSDQSRYISEKFPYAIFLIE